ncbi:MAG: HDOD domain-containing protein [Deltaproteobacteria bacterium]|jgi:putative nucleotidyltransferase with HDIG domain|nr:HDOD domain-containing protein [Deltaproteobacteria bacterium]
MTAFALPQSEVEFKEWLLELVNTLSALIEERDPKLKKHSKRVADNSANFCTKYKLLSDDDIYKVYLAGLLHDIGLIFSPKTLLKDAEDRSEEEKVQLRKHPVVGQKIISNLSTLKDLLPLIRHHHEAMDGSGYPDGLSGDEIPIGARIISLFNELDTLMYPFSKTSAATALEALVKIKQDAGTRYDSKLIDQFAEYIEATSAESDDYLMVKANDSIKDIFTKIIHDFTAGNILPPVMPQVVKEVQAVIKKPSSTAEDIAVVIEKDPVISLRLISVANSPVYRGIHKIRNLKEAIPRLGLKETLSLVIAIANKSLYETDQAKFKILMDKLWVHSLASAYGAKLIAEHLKLPDPENYFLMGLVHDIGKSLLLKAFTSIFKEKKINFDVIQANIQQGHLSIGGVLLRRWGFDDIFIKVVTEHERLEFPPDTPKEILIVQLTNMLTRTIGYSLFDDPVELSELDSTQLLEIDPQRLDEIGAEMRLIIQDVAHLF